MGVFMCLCMCACACLHVYAFLCMCILACLCIFMHVLQVWLSMHVGMYEWAKSHMYSSYDSLCSVFTFLWWKSFLHTKKMFIIFWRDKKMIILFLVFIYWLGSGHTWCNSYTVTPFSIWMIGVLYWWLELLDALTLQWLLLLVSVGFVCGLCQFTRFSTFILAFSATRLVGLGVVFGSSSFRWACWPSSQPIIGFSWSFKKSLQRGSRYLDQLLVEDIATSAIGSSAHKCI